MAAESNFNVLHNSQWITFPTLSCRVMYYFAPVCWIIFQLLAFTTWLFTSFSHQFSVVVFHWALRKSPQVLWTLLRIQADLNNAVVCIGSILSLYSSSSILFSKHLETCPSPPTIIRINVTFLFLCLFSLVARSKYLSLLSLSFIFTQWFLGLAKSTGWHVLFFLLIRPTSCPLDGIRRSVWFYSSHFLGWIWVCAYTIWHNGQISISCTIFSGSLFLPLSCLVLYSFNSCFIHLFITTLTV